MPSLILASASPRRAQLLTQARIPFQVLISPTPEPTQKPAAIPTDLWPICLAYIKARAVQKTLESQPPKLKTRHSKLKSPTILAADTIVVAHLPSGEKILNKASSKSHARRMLKSLRGRTHRVITGIALLQRRPDGTDRLRLSSATALCKINNVSDAFLETYLDSGLWKGKAGAYGIQDSPPTSSSTHHPRRPAAPTPDPFITLLSGDITTVIGLPMPLLLSELASLWKD